MGLSVTGSVVTSTGRPHSLPTMDVPFSMVMESGAGPVCCYPRRGARPFRRLYASERASRRPAVVVDRRRMRRNSGWPSRPVGCYPPTRSAASTSCARAPFCRLYASGEPAALADVACFHHRRGSRRRRRHERRALGDARSTRSASPVNSAGSRGNPAGLAFRAPVGTLAARGRAFALPSFLSKRSDAASSGGERGSSGVGKTDALARKMSLVLPPYGATDGERALSSSCASAASKCLCRRASGRTPCHPPGPSRDGGAGVRAACATL